MKGMIVTMTSAQLSHQGKPYDGFARVFPDGFVKFDNPRYGMHAERFPSQLLGIRTLEQRGYKLKATAFWEEAEV